MSQGLLDVDVLAGGAGVDRDRHVPVVRRRDEHGVDVLTFEDGAVVLGRLGARLGEGARPLEVPVPDVADRDDAHALDLAEIRYEPPEGAAARADAADPDALGGRVAEGRRAGRRRRDAQGAETRGFQELSSAQDLAFHRSTPCFRGDGLPARLLGIPGYLELMRKFSKTSA